MLRERIFTAVVLLALMVPTALASTTLPFELLTLLMMAAAAWEWARLSGIGPAGSLAFGLAVGSGCAVAGPFGAGLIGIGPFGADLRPGAAVWMSTAALWLLGGAFLLRGGPQGFGGLSRAVRGLVGGLLLAAGWFALVELRRRGLAFLLSTCLLVWVADSAAYFGGRRFGRRKLAPAISPAKSWEGVWSGLAGVAVLSLACLAWGRLSGNGVGHETLFEALLRRHGPLGMGLSVALLVALAVIGDLCESLAKRAAGVKDSSRLLPGHGGVLDRIDALLPVFPAALALVA